MAKDTKRPKRPPYRVALVSEDLRYRLAEAITGNEYRTLLGSPGEWIVRDFVLSDQAVRHHIKELSGIIDEDERPYPSWAALEEELINEPAQIAGRAETLRIARERAAKKRAERRAA
ncbi:hypothetical protein [Gluconobacter kondonii]|uniref:hypothetical protein n=1 Tax=Gluconobacter kondonii TaxID=941463 RepID=UPI001B8BFF8A|nr:hypothetical protein [Gluconobacter kondonii]MBS1058317.1 hypothetical protein [Gluconobacter kondonii]